MKLYSRPALLLATLFLGGGLWSFLSKSSPTVTATTSLTRSESLLKLAHQLQIESQLVEAESIYGDLLVTGATETGLSQGIQAKIGLIEISIERGQYQEALKLVQELLSTGEFEGHQLLLAKVLCTKGEAEIRYGDYVQADESINACQDVYTHIPVGTLELEAYAEHLRGFLYHVQGYYLKALDHYQSSLKLKSRADGVESTDYSNTLNNIGNVYTRLGDFNQALNYHNETLQIRRHNLPAGHPKIGGSFGNLGNVYDALGNTLAAIQHHEQAAIIWKANFGEWHPDLGFSYDNLGQDFNKLSEYNNANKVYSNAIEIKRKVLNKNHPSLATSLYGRGMALMGMGQVQLAQESVGEAILIYEESHLTHHPKYFETLGLYSQILYRLGEQSASFDTFKIAIDLALKTNPRKAVSILNDFATALLKSNRLEEALEFCHKALSINMNQGSDINAEFNPPIGSFYNIFEAIRSLVIKASALNAIPNNSNSVRSKGEVLETYERALEIAVYSRRLKVALESKNDLNRDIDNLANGAIASALELFELTNDERLLDRIFRVVEFQKSGHFFDDLTDAQAKIIAHVPDSLKLREIDLRNQLAAFDRQLSQSSANLETDDAAATIRHQRFIKRKQLDDLVAYTERIFPKYYSLKHGGIYASIEDVINNLLKPKQAAIQYFESDNQIYAIALDTDKIKLFHLSDHVFVSKLITEFTSFNSGVFEQKYFDLLYELHQVLIAPITAELNTSKLLIIPNELMNQVPFDALLTAPIDVKSNPSRFAQDFPFLIKSFGINTGYSATLLVEQSKIQLPNFKTQLLALGPVFDTQEAYSPAVNSFLKSISTTSPGQSLTLQPLLGSLSELTEIEKIVDSKVPLWKRLWNDQTEILLRHSVTEHDLKERDLTAYRYLHFATHSFADQRSPVNSGILLQTNESSGEDGILHASEIFGLKISAELVVLSSCETALDFAGGSVGISGFAKGFIYAGAKNIIASLWPSDDTATMLLMRQFYLNLNSDPSIDSALRKSKIQLITSDGPISHPYYWSGFIHIGSSPGS